MVGTIANRAKIQKAREILDGMISEVLQKGFFGEAVLRLKVMDGTIQHVDQSITQSHRS